MDFEVKDKLEGKKKKYLLVMIIVLCLEIVGGLAFWKLSATTYGNEVNFSKAEEGDLSSLRIMMMTDSLKEYGLMAPEDFYVCFNNYGNYLVRIASDQSFEYQEYIDYFYYEREEAPEPVKISGIAVKPDEKLKEVIMNAVSQMVEEEFAAEEFEDIFGTYYLDTVYRSTPAWMLWMIGAGMLLGIGIIVFCIIGFGKAGKELAQREGVGQISHDALTEGTYAGTAGTEGMMNGFNTEEAKPIQGYWIKGIIGTFLGACVGGVIWLLLGTVGNSISAKVGLLIYLLALVGFAVATKGKEAEGIKGAMVVAAVIGSAVLFGSHYLVWAWKYYEFMDGTLSLGKAILTAGKYMTEKWYWGDFFRELLFGVCIAGIACVVGFFNWIFGKIKRK